MKLTGAHQQLMPLDVSSQATASAPFSGTTWQQSSSHASCSTPVPRQPSPIDVERSHALEQVKSVSGSSTHHTSVSPSDSSKPSLLPAGVMSAFASQLSKEGAAPQSASPHASVDALAATSSAQQTTNAGSMRSKSGRPNPNHVESLAVTVPHQLDFLMTDDPVATAIAEANKVVADRAGLMSLADQRREALSLHVQAKDTYFAAAQTAHEKGNIGSEFRMLLQVLKHQLICLLLRPCAVGHWLGDHCILRLLQALSVAHYKAVATSVLSGQAAPCIPSEVLVFSEGRTCEILLQKK